MNGGARKRAWGNVIFLLHSKNGNATETNMAMENHQFWLEIHLQRVFFHISFLWRICHCIILVSKALLRSRSCWLDSKFHLPYIQILKAVLELDSKHTIVGYDSSLFPISLSHGAFKWTKIHRTFWWPWCKSGSVSFLGNLAKVEARSQKYQVFQLLRST